ncbi:unnamed protein product [Camellia sinensis]
MSEDQSKTTPSIASFSSISIYHLPFTRAEKDAALGNGGLGRLASCFLDSMATLNLPAWGYGLRYIYGLFKQRLAKRAKKKLSKTDLRSLAIGKLSDMTLCSLSNFLVKLKYIPLDLARKWVGGEVVQSLAYDVPIPGYKTKNTINLHLWEAKAGAEDFNLFQFNDGQYESAAQLHFRAQQDMIVRFKERKDRKSSWQWYKFPNKVVVQLNDTHPTLAIPELMRLLMDDDGLGWDEAWDVTTRAIAYTNHTILPEALEKCSQAVMWKLLPHHMEIIEEIDKRFIAMIRSTKPELESKLSSMRIMDNNPQKPVVRMENLCVVSSHTSLYFQAEWESAKMADKQRLAQFIFQVTGVSIDPNSLFDLQFKRIHEYKRQLLNILGVVYRYKKLKFIAMIRSTKPELESKLSSMRIMDNNPQKPVVRMENLCVVSSHTNKTNGITPRRWL